jgi:hypothetical protein
MRGLHGVHKIISNTWNSCVEYMDTADPTWISHGNEMKTSTYIWWKICGFQVDAIWTPCRFYIELCGFQMDFMWGFISSGFYVHFHVD